MHVLTALLAGLLFGGGLAVAGMTSPDKVIAFLNITGDWDPSLAFVMGGALAVFAPAYWLVGKRRERPLLCPAFDLPTKTQITPQLLVGATIFGVGWGVGGFCPGTVITSLPTGTGPVLTVSIGVFVGILMTWGMQKALSEPGVPITQADF